MIKIYTVDGCGVCSKTIEWLKKHNVKYEIVDLKQYET